MHPIAMDGMHADLSLCEFVYSVNGMHVCVYLACEWYVFLCRVKAVLMATSIQRPPACIERLLCDGPKVSV